MYAYVYAAMRICLSNYISPPPPHTHIDPPRLISHPSYCSCPFSHSSCWQVGRASEYGASPPHPRHQGSDHPRPELLFNQLVVLEVRRRVNADILSSLSRSYPSTASKDRRKALHHYDTFIQPPIEHGRPRKLVRMGPCSKNNTTRSYTKKDVCLYLISLWVSTKMFSRHVLNHVQDMFRQLLWFIKTWFYLLWNMVTYFWWVPQQKIGKGYRSYKTRGFAVHWIGSQMRM